MLLCACPCGSAASCGLAAESDALLPIQSPRTAQIWILMLGSTTPRQQNLFPRVKHKPDRGIESTAHPGQFLPKINRCGVYQGIA